jgi:hypothetical protein
VVSRVAGNRSPVSSNKAASRAEAASRSPASRASNPDRAGKKVDKADKVDKAASTASVKLPLPGSFQPRFRPGLFFVDCETNNLKNCMHDRSRPRGIKHQRRIGRKQPLIKY